MKILVCGGRNFSNRSLMQEVIFQNFYPGDTLIHGDAKGADRLSEECKQPYTEVIRYPANWKLYGRQAGPFRNKQMLDEGKPDLVIVFPGGVGTAHMVRIAKEANIKVIEVKENGSIQRPQDTGLLRSGVC